MCAMTVEDINRAHDACVISVDVPEWGGEVFLRQMTVAQAEKYQAELPKTPGADTATELLRLTLCQADGRLLYEGWEKTKALDALKARSIVVISKLAVRSADHNAQGRDPVAAAVKNSIGDAPDVTRSSSPEPPV